MNSPSVLYIGGLYIGGLYIGGLYIDDFPPALELRKGTQGYCVKTASSGYTAVKMLEEIRKCA